MRTLFLLLSLTVSGCVFSQDYNAISSRAKHIIDSTYKALIDQNNVVGASIAIVHNGRIVYAAGYGFSDLEDSIPADNNTIYRIGSCTKSFTALAILQQQERNRMNLDDPISTYIPELTIASRFAGDNPLLVRDMLTHTSGLPCDVVNGFFCDSPPDINWLVKELNRQTMIAPRNYSFAYSNTAYGLLGEAIARTSGKSYSDYLTENIFTPLDMTSSFVKWNDTLGKRFSKGYSDGKLSYDPMIRDEAAGLIHSNVIDMAHYIQFYLDNGSYKGKQIVDSSMLRDMESNHISGIYLNEGGSYGYGLTPRDYYLKKDADSALVRVIGHGGDTYLFHADFDFIPELNIGAVVLTNSETGTSMNSAIKLINTYLKAETKEKFTGPVIAAKPPYVRTCTLSEIKGSYNFGAFGITVGEKEKLKFRQGKTKIVLKPKYDDSARYTMTIRVLGFIPLKYLSQEFRFVKMGDQVFAKIMYVKTGKEKYAARRSENNPPAENWKNHFGTYQLAGEFYACKDCPKMNMEGAEAVLSEKDGFLQLTIHSENVHRTLVLEQLSDTMAISGGLGRGTGETVRILDNGNIYYSGFEFSEKTASGKK